VARLEGLGLHPGCRGGAARVQLRHLDREPAPDPGGTGKQALHRLGEPLADARRAGHGQGRGAPGELGVEDQERQPAEMVPVQV
jgi:hypothetical protein